MTIEGFTPGITTGIPKPVQPDAPTEIKIITAQKELQPLPHLAPKYFTAESLALKPSIIVAELDTAKSDAGVEGVNLANLTKMIAEKEGETVVLQKDPNGIIEVDISAGPFKNPEYAINPDGSVLLNYKQLFNNKHFQEALENCDIVETKDSNGKFSYSNASTGAQMTTYEAMKTVYGMMPRHQRLGLE